MAKKPAEKDGKYVLLKSRFIEGQYLTASPEAPAVIEVPKGFPVDDGMIPIEKYTSQEAKPHYVVKAPPTSPLTEALPTIKLLDMTVDPATRVITETPKMPEPVALVVEGSKGKGRASDKSPV